MGPKSTSINTRAAVSWPVHFGLCLAPLCSLFSCACAAVPTVLLRCCWSAANGSATKAGCSRTALRCCVSSTTSFCLCARGAGKLCLWGPHGCARARENAHLFLLDSDTPPSCAGVEDDRATLASDAAISSSSDAAIPPTAPSTAAFPARFARLLLCAESAGGGAAAVRVCSSL